MSHEILSGKNNDRLILGEARYNAIASRLYDLHREEIDRGCDRIIDGDSDDIAAAVHRLPPAVRERYWAHGVVRGTSIDQIRSIVSLLDTHVMLGSAAPLVQPSEGQGTLGAYLDGGFLVISRRDGKSLIEGLTAGDPRYVEVITRTGTKLGVRVDPGAVIYNLGLESVARELRKLFPQERIIPASELGRYVAREESRVSPSR